MNPINRKTEEEWMAIIEAFAKEIEMTACLTDDNGTIIACRGDRYPLCSAVRDNPEATTYICSQIASNMLQMVKKSLQPEVDMCDVGLLRIVVPIVHDGVLVGQITACGLATEDEEISELLLNKQLGLDDNAVRELVKSTPVGSEEKVHQAGKKLFEKLNS